MNRQQVDLIDINIDDFSFHTIAKQQTIIQAIVEAVKLYSFVQLCCCC